MCGIYGITEHNPTLIQNYIRRCSHRGPDGEKIWWDPEHKVTLGHNLLSIMSSPNLSVQPWKTPAGNWLIYNGEIFNYYELKEKYKNHIDLIDYDNGAVKIVRVNPNRALK